MKRIILLTLLISVFISEFRAQNKVSKNVFIPEDSVYIKQLDRYRKIRIYLPPDYKTSEKKYPVLYMMDGQNLFDPKTSYLGEWGVDETLDSLYKSDGFSIIVVGIDNGQMKRMNEYSPWENKRFGKAEGKEYVEFIVNNLKPMIDSIYRTLPDRKNTGIMGSSMGGLISHYALLEYPQVFSKAGVFSPSYWFAKDVFTQTESSVYDNIQKMYILIEDKESNPPAKDVFKMEEILKQKGFNEQNLKIINDQEAKHNEAFWRKYFSVAVKFLFWD